MLISRRVTRGALTHTHFDGRDAHSEPEGQLGVGVHHEELPQADPVDDPVHPGGPGAHVECDDEEPHPKLPPSAP